MKINAQDFLCLKYLVYLNVNEMLKQAAFTVAPFQIRSSATGLFHLVSACSERAAHASLQTVFI